MISSSFVSKTPFPLQTTLAELIADDSISEFYFGGPADSLETILLNSEGRYVRIQLSGSGILHMAEVELMGCLANPSPCDLAQPVTIESSGPFNDTDAVQILSGSPEGGTWSGASTDGTFDPSIGGGSYSVTYTYDNGLGCTQSDTTEIVVIGCILDNIALGRTATQSSTYGDGVASLAIDGNMSGTSPWSADLQHTNNELTPWWEIDLGTDYIIDNLNIFNRSDKLQARLNNFYVFISKTPFSSDISLTNLIADTSLTQYFFAGPAGLQENITLNAEGRYVRVQLSGSGILHMSELEVIGCPVDDDTTFLKVFGNQSSSDDKTVESQSDLFQITLVPNPGSNIIHFKVKGQGIIYKVAVYDSTGRLITEKNFSESTSSLNTNFLEISQLVSGIYQVYFTLKDGRIQTKNFLKK